MGQQTNVTFTNKSQRAIVTSLGMRNSYTLTLDSIASRLVFYPSERA